LSFRFHEGQELAGREIDPSQHGQFGLHLRSASQTLEKPSNGAALPDTISRCGFCFPANGRGQCICEDSHFFFSLDQAGDANRQFFLNHLKFGPRQLRASRPERQIFSMRPT
jgi:hypothetical protein